MWTFADYRLDDRQRSLRREEGVVRLEPRVMDLLLYLVRNRDRAVSREELVEHVWSGVALERSAIPGAVKKLRQSLQGARDAIETVRGHGFRFAATVTELPAAGEERARSSAPLPPGAQSAAELALPSLAARPFRTLAQNDRELGALLAETLLLRIHEYRAFSVLALHGAERSAATTGDALDAPAGARYVIRGSLWRACRGSAAAAWLIDTHHSRVVWSLRAETQEPDAAAAIDALSAQIAAALWTAFMFGRVAVSPSPAAGPAGDAWSLACAGWRAYWSETLAGMRSSLELFDASLRIEQRNPWALVGRSVAHFARHCFEPEGDAHLEAALADVAAAAELDPAGMLHRGYRALYQAALGRSSEALYDLCAADRAAPGLPWILSTIAELQTFRDPDAALGAYREALAANPGGELQGRILTGMAAAQRFAGDLEAAVQSAEQAICAKPGVPYGYLQAAAACGALGRPAAGEGLLARMKASVRPVAPHLVHAHLRLRWAGRPQYAEETAPFLRAAGWSELL